MATGMFWTQPAFAAWQPAAPLTGAGAAGVALFLLWMWFRRSEKAQSCAQPFLCVIAGLGAFLILAGGGGLVLLEYSRSDPRASQDGLVLLVALGVLAVIGGLLWIGRTTEGDRILEFVWLVLKFTPIAIFVALLVLGMLFGMPKHP